MPAENRFLDDLARVATGALGVAAGVRSEAESLLRQRFARLLDDMDLVTREEFEAVKAMAQKARAEQEDLHAAARSTSPGQTGAAASRSRSSVGPIAARERASARRATSAGCATEPASTAPTSARSRSKPLASNVRNRCSDQAAYPAKATTATT